MREEWAPARLGDLVSIEHGWPFKSEQFNEELTGKPIVVAVGNFRYDGGFRFHSTATKEYRGEYPKSYELTPGDTLLIMTCQTQGGEILGIPARVPDDGRTYLHNQRLGKVVVRAPDKIDSGFLYHLFRSRDFNLALCATASGSKILHTAPTRIEAFEFQRPPLETQRAIAAALGSLDDKIEQNRRTGRKLEELARAVFKAWFVDFEPVKAKAAGATAFPGMPADTFGTLPTRLVDSDLGPVPEGCKQASLRDLAMFITGGTPSKKDANFWNGTFPWVSAKDMHGRIVSDSELRLTDAGRDSVRKIAPRHSTLMVIRGMSLMTEVRIGWCTREVAFNQDLRAFIARDGVPPEFINLWLTSSEEQLMHMVDTASHGTGRILTDRLDSMTIARPSDAVMRVFVEMSRPVMALRESLHGESAKLAALRDYLLPRLLSGRCVVAPGEVS